MYRDYNNSDNWDEEQWQEHYQEMAHEKFLKTSKGKQWQKEKKQEQFNKNLKNFVIIVIGIIILLLIIKAGGCNFHSSNEPYRR